MKRSRYAVIAFCLFLMFQWSVAQERSFGLGTILGEPMGISAKLWTSDYTAFNFGLGWSMGGDQIGKYGGYYYGGNRVHGHMDFVWYSFDAIHSSERYPLYYGFGGRINNGAGVDASVSVRGVLGIAWLPRGMPIDIFMELVPMLRLTSSSGFGIDSGVGARYFF